MIDVRVGDEWSVDGMTARVVGVDGERVHLSAGLGEYAAWRDDHVRLTTDGLNWRVATLSWALPRVGDVWISPVAARYAVTTIASNGCIALETDEQNCANVALGADELRAHGWRPAPRSPAATTKAKNPEPQVGDVWDFKDGARWDVGRIADGLVTLTNGPGKCVVTRVEMVGSEYWRRVSAAPAKPTLDPAAHPLGGKDHF